MPEPIAEILRGIVRGEVSDDDAAIAAYEHDASIFKLAPEAVVFPEDSADIGAVVAYADAHADEGVSITPRSAGTDMSGGAIGESIVLDVSKHMNRIKEIGDGFAVTEPGVFYRDFEKATLAKGWLLPSYPASREICTVGGMAANNSGGEKSLRYGKTENFVERLKAVLSDGREYELGPLTRTELDMKMAQNDFEGGIYRGIFDLVEKGYDAVKAAKPRVSKNSAGYNLWDVWDRRTFDLSKLLVGSQGTLGVITEIRYRLVKPAPHSKLVVIFLENLDRLPEIINVSLEHQPESFESYDDYTLKFAVRYFGDIMKFLGTKNLLKFAWQFLPEAWLTLTRGVPKQILLIELTGETLEEVDAKIAAVKAALAPFRLAMRVTRSEKEARKYWVVRRESFNLLRRHFKKMKAAPFVDDFCVRPADLPKFLPELYAILRPYGLMLTVVGHMGDANFHIIPLMDLGDPKAKRVIIDLSREVYGLVFRYGGSMTGEHNDGLVRGPYLEKMFGRDFFASLKRVKAIFDPKGILNPHKKTDATLDFTMDHLSRE